MTDKKFLIGLHGKPRVGKDTTANYLIKKLKLLRYGPSVRVKDTAAVMFDVPREYFDDDNMKDVVDPFWGITYRQMAQKVGKESSRDVFGDDIWMRHVEKQLLKMNNYKVCQCKHPYEVHTIVAPMDYYGCTSCGCNEYRYDETNRSPYNGIILADIRYENEIEWVHKHGGDVFFVVRDDAPKSSDQGHVVDAGLPLKLADLIIYNNGSVEDLYTRIENELAFFYSWPE